MKYLWIALLALFFLFSACASEVPDDDDSSGDDDDSSGDDDEGPCVAVSGSALEPWFAVDMTGTGFDDYEGRRARVVVVLNVKASRFGVADTTIVGGQFAVSLPEARSAAYTEVAVYIDADGDDRCGDDEPLWSYTTPGGPGDILLEITPSTPEPLFATAGCLMNGWFDLSVEIPCPG
jgi:hypothetical protein